MPLSVVCAHLARLMTPITRIQPDWKTTRAWCKQCWLWISCRINKNCSTSIQFKCEHFNSELAFATHMPMPINDKSNIFLWKTRKLFPWFHAESFSNADVSWEGSACNKTAFRESKRVQCVQQKLLNVVAIKSCCEFQCQAAFIHISQSIIVIVGCSSVIGRRWFWPNCYETRTAHDNDTIDQASSSFLGT